MAHKIHKMSKCFYVKVPYWLLSFRWIIVYHMQYYEDVLHDIAAIREERDTEKRLTLLQELNDSLPEWIRLEMPSLLTNAYVRKALDMIEDKILVSA
jgi:hypothetical protein